MGDDGRRRAEAHGDGPDAVERCSRRRQKSGSLKQMQRAGRALRAYVGVGVATKACVQRGSGGASPFESISRHCSSVSRLLIGCLNS